MNNSQQSMNLIGLGSGYLGPGVASNEAVTQLASYIMSQYDKNNSGKLDNSNIASIMIDMYRSVNKKFSLSKYDIETYSNVMDHNKDGRINQSDLENLIRKYLAVNVDITRTTTTKSVVTTKTISRKKDIDFDELRRTFDHDDLDRDGKIGRYEFGRILLANANKFGIDPAMVNTDEIFAKIDSDKDGKINFTQFTEGVRMA